MLKIFSIVQCYMVVIVWVLVFDVQVVIFDELIVVFFQYEIFEFYYIVECLKQDGKVILFILYKFDEIFELVDYYIILCDGVYVSFGVISDIIEEWMVLMMVGWVIS